MSPQFYLPLGIAERSIIVSELRGHVPRDFLGISTCRFHMLQNGTTTRIYTHELGILNDALGYMFGKRLIHPELYLEVPA